MNFARVLYKSIVTVLSQCEGISMNNSFIDIFLDFVFTVAAGDEDPSIR